MDEIEDQLAAVSDAAAAVYLRNPQRWSSAEQFALHATEDLREEIVERIHNNINRLRRGGRLIVFEDDSLLPRRKANSR